jgi:hypothetical protein
MVLVTIGCSGNAKGVCRHVLASPLHGTYEATFALIHENTERNGKGPSAHASKLEGSFRIMVTSFSMPLHWQKADCRHSVTVTTANQWACPSMQFCNYDYKLYSAVYATESIERNRYMPCRVFTAAYLYTYQSHWACYDIA